MEDPLRHVTEALDPHPIRHRMILANHPEIAYLYGRNPWTAGLVVGLVGLQLALAVAVGNLPVWAALAVSWAVGAWVAHALFAGMHEATHRLIFRSHLANKLVLVGANLPLIVPFSIGLAHWHRVHHRRQGQRAWDPDLPSEWEVATFDRWGMPGRLAWHVLFPVLQLFRIARPAPGDALSLAGAWPLANLVAQVAVTALLAWALPLASLVYLVGSIAFVFALHPLAGRFIQEHHHPVGPFPDASDNPIPAAIETGSYVGAANVVALNFGLHIEHHDFPAIPWNRLPALRRIAPEGYAHTVVRRSWTWALLEFLFHPNSAVGGRTVRPRVPAPVSRAADASASTAESSLLAR